MRVVPTYIVLGAAFSASPLCFRAWTTRAIVGDHEAESGDHGSYRALFRYPLLWFAIIANFCNVGAQVATWSSLIPYMKQFTGVSERTAAGYLTATLVAMAAGRSFGTLMMKYFRPATLLSIYACVNVALLSVAILLPGMPGAYAIVVSSFFLSIMFPTIFALGLKGLGPNTKTCRLAARHGHCRRSGLPAGPRLDRKKHGQRRERLHRAALRICRGRSLRPDCAPEGYGSPRA